MSKLRVLFVCLGNICRSPAAEGIFLKEVEKQKLADKFSIDSAGTSGHHDGEMADPRMRQAASKRSIELVTLSRKFIPEDFENFDEIIVMDGSNYDNVIKLARDENDKQKVKKMTDYTTGVFTKYDHVPDPYFGGEEGFEEVLDLLQNSCGNLLKSLTK